MNDQPSTARTALKWGAILGLVLMAITLVMYLTDQATNPLFTGLTLGGMVAVLILSMRDYRTLNGGYMSYSEGLGIGALLSAVAGILSSAFSTFYNVVIDPTVQQRAMEKARENWKPRGRCPMNRSIRRWNGQRSFNHLALHSLPVFLGR